MADDLELWARNHIVLDGPVIGDCRCEIRGLDLQPQLAAYRANPNLNAGPLWAHFSENSGFQDRVNDLLASMPWRGLYNQFSTGPCLEFLRACEFARWIDEKLLRESSPKHGEHAEQLLHEQARDTPSAGLLAAFRIALIKCARSHRDFIFTARNYRKTRHRELCDLAARRAAQLEDVAQAWEYFYEDLKAGNMLGLRKVTAPDELDWFEAVLAYGANTFRCAALGVPLTSSSAADYRRLRSRKIARDASHESEETQSFELPKLNASQRVALEFIREHGPVPGKAIAKQMNLSFEHIRKWFARGGVLYEHGVRNSRNGDGYSISG